MLEMNKKRRYNETVIYAQRRFFSLKQCTTVELFDLNHTIAKPLLERCQYPWQALDKIEEFLLYVIEQLPHQEYKEIAAQVWAHHSAVVAASASLTGPCIIGPGAEIRHCAFVRGNALIGAQAVVGNSTELKNCILFDKAQVPHFNYVGDSILGYGAHMGAGAVTSNLKSDKTLVQVKMGKEVINTNRKKMGAMVGDEAEVGCNSVLCPGTILGKKAQIYPTSCVRGVVPENSIFKSANSIVKRQ